MKQKMNQNKPKMEIENKSQSQIISVNNREQITFDNENNSNIQKVIISEDFGKINNITN